MTPSTCEISEHLETADVVLLLISSDFIASDYCYDVEMTRALARHEAGEARVIPVILRPADWQTERLARLQALPTDAKPVNEWRDRDAAFLDVTRGIRRVVEELRGRGPEPLYPHDAVRGLSEALGLAYRRKAELEAKGDDTAAVVYEVLDLKRRLREGAQLQPGDLLADGRYQLIEPIGQGGFARVWKAYDDRRHSVAAVKVLHTQYAEDRTRRERFFRGARQMARLQHPGIVRVIEVPAKEIPLDLGRGKADIKLIRPQVVMHEPNRMDGRGKRTSGRRFIPNSRSLEDVNTQYGRDSAVEQGLLRPRIKIRFDIHSADGIRNT
jgi:hypothetical protein